MRNYFIYELKNLTIENNSAKFLSKALHTK